MESALVSFNAVFPMFCIVGVGLFARRQKLVSERFSGEINTLLFKIFIPVMLFYSIATASAGETLPLELSLFASLGFVLIFALGMLIVPRLEKERSRCGATVQALFRTNYSMVGMPLAVSLLGQPYLSRISLMAAITIPIFNVLAVLAIEPFSGVGVKPTTVVKKILLNPLIIGSVLGIVFFALSIPLPGVIGKALSDLKTMSTPLSLFSLGMSVDLQRIGSFKKSLLWTVFMRLAAVPFLVLTTAYFLGFHGGDMVILICLFAAPVSVSAHVMVEKMGGDGEFAAGVTMLSTALSCVTLFLWVAGFHMLGALA